MSLKEYLEEVKERLVNAKMATSSVLRAYEQLKDLEKGEWFLEKQNNKISQQFTKLLKIIEVQAEALEFYSLAPKELFNESMFKGKIIIGVDTKAREAQQRVEEIIRSEDERD